MRRQVICGLHSAVSSPSLYTQRSGSKSVLLMVECSVALTAGRDQVAGCTVGEMVALLARVPSVSM
jgi:hypothetical protein